MKKVLYSVAGLFLSTALVSTAYGGGIDNKTNWSAEYIRTLNRNAATDFADIAAYNPAGTVKLQDGFIINGSVQYLGKKYTNNITHALLGGEADLESDEPSVVPSLFAVYNKDRWSLFGSMTVVGGGGKVDFSDGNATTFQIATNFLFGPLYCGGAACNMINSQQLEGESFYLGYTIGSAFEINEMFSVSAGLRYVNAHKEAEGTAIVSNGGSDPFPVTADYEQEGDGWGGIFGVNFAPNNKLNIGMRYETKTSLDLEASVNASTAAKIVGANVLAARGIFDGESNDRDLPAIFAIGVSYWLTPKFRVETNYTHYFNEDADWDGAEDNVEDGYDLGVALEYHFNDSLRASIGYLYTVLGVDPEDMLPENPELDANTVGAGIAYAINDNLHTNISIGNSFYKDDSFGIIEYEKNVFFLAMGLEYRF